MKKLLMACFLVSIMAVTILGSLVLAEEPAALTIILPGERPQDMDLVAAELEKVAGKAIGPIKLNFQFYGFNDFAGKVSLLAIAGEQMDLIFDPAWLNFYQMQAQGAFMPINKYIKDLSFFGKPSNVSAEIWKQVSVEGKIYGLPAVENNYVVRDAEQLIVRKDLIQKYAPKGITTGAQFLTFLRAVKKNEPQYILFAQDDVNIVPKTATYYKKASSTLTPWCNVGDWDLNIMVNAKEGGGPKAPKIFCSVSTKEFENDVVATVNLRKEGLFSDEVIQDKRAAFKAGRMAFFGGDWSDYAMGVGPAVKDTFGAVWVRFELQKQGILVRATGNWFNVGGKCKNPEKAIAFVNWIMESRDNYELWAYGIKGTHFRINDKNVIEKIDPEKRRYEMLWWYIFNRDHLRQDLGNYPDVVAYQKWCNDSKNVIPNPTIGFPLNQEPVKTQLAQIRAVNSEYTALMLGKGDPKSMLPKYRNALKAAGIDQAIAEFQKQFDAWWAKNQ